MRYSTEKLMFAAIVQEQAVALANAAFEQDKKKAFGSKSNAEFLRVVESGEFEAWQATWHQSHPIETYLQEALDRIESVADFIFQSPRDQQPLSA